MPLATNRYKLSLVLQAREDFETHWHQLFVPKYPLSVRQNTPSALCQNTPLCQGQRAKILPRRPPRQFVLKGVFWHTDLF